jgi:hypothetical protein
MKLALRLLLAFLAALLALELALQLFPALLPRGYRARFPMQGVELFHPGVLERTPVEGLPLPLLGGPQRGPPPSDLKELGVVPPEEESDARAFPEVEIPADGLGFPNPTELERADLALIGDSFAVAMGVTRPAGLQARLARATGLRVFNAGVAGIGPVQERWLLEAVVLPKQPRAVLWFFFEGNDLSASYEPLLHRQAGRTTWAEAYADRRRPRLFLPDLLAHVFSPRSGEPRCSPLPAFLLRRADGSAQRLWFHPDYLRQLATGAADWAANPVWAAVQAELRAARDACRARGTRLLLVYLPTKEALYLPRVEPDPALLLRTASATLAAPLPVEPAAFQEQALANRHALEELVRAFCAAEGIPFLPATPGLEALAARGELGFLVADSHWQSVGQEALLEPLLAFLREQGVLE